MPAWSIGVYALMLLVSIAAGIYIYHSKMWKGGFPFGNLQILKVLGLIFVPALWMILILFIGLLLFVLGEVQSNAAMVFIAYIGIPIVFLVSIIVFFIVHQVINNKNEKKMKQDIEKKVEQCREWVEKFPFINNEMIEVKIYISNGKPVGRLIIQNISLEQVSSLDKSKSLLPEGIYLELVSEDESNNTLH